MDWKLEIKKVSNGYILRGRFDNGETISTLIIQEKGVEGDELEAMEKLLWEIKEYFGVYYSKHNKKNLVIEIQENETL